MGTPLILPFGFTATMQRTFSAPIPPINPNLNDSHIPIIDSPISLIKFSSLNGRKIFLSIYVV